MSDSHVPRFDEISQEYLADLNYNLRLAGGDGQYFYALKIQHIRRVLSRAPESILDFGCATGEFTKLLSDTFPEARVIGYDPAAKCIEEAKKNIAGGNLLTFVSDLSEISIEPDLVVATGVFHHIDKLEKQNAADKIFKLLRKDGHLVVFEHNPYSPLTQLIVAMCELDRGATLLSRSKMEKLFEKAGFDNVASKYISFFPPVLKFLLPTEKYLEQVPAGAQYLVWGKKTLV